MITVKEISALMMRTWLGDMICPWHRNCEDCERDGICDVIDEAIEAVIETGEYH